MTYDKNNFATGSIDNSPCKREVNRKRPVHCFTLSENLSEKIKDLKKTKIDGKKVNVSALIESLLSQAIEQMENPINYSAMIKGYSPVTLMLRNEVAEFINALFVTGGYGLTCANKRNITPYTVGEKISESICSGLFLSGDVELANQMDFESKMSNARNKAKEMYRNMD